MPDIFLSYNREDQGVARRFAEAFEAQGFDVWWDLALRSGESYDQVTEQALSDAKAVVVLWSPRSVGSEWVRAEATQAKRAAWRSHKAGATCHSQTEPGCPLGP